MNFTREKKVLSGIKCHPFHLYALKEKKKAKKVLAFCQSKILIPNDDTQDPENGFLEGFSIWMKQAVLKVWLDMSHTNFNSISTTPNLIPSYPIKISNLIPHIFQVPSNWHTPYPVLETLSFPLDRSALNEVLFPENLCDFYQENIKKKINFTSWKIV